MDTQLNFPTEFISPKENQYFNPGILLGKDLKAHPISPSEGHLPLTKVAEHFQELGI